MKVINSYILCLLWVRIKDWILDQPNANFSLQWKTIIWNPAYSLKHISSVFKYKQKNHIRYKQCLTD